MTSSLSSLEVAELLVAENWIGYQVVVMGAIITAESERDPLAYHLNTDHTLDQGLTQLNSKWTDLLFAQLDIRVTVADYNPLVYDPQINVRWARIIWSDTFNRTAGKWGTKSKAAYSRWNTYETPSYLKNLPEAMLAARQAGAQGI